MHQSLEAILQLITEAELPEEGKAKLLKALTEADKQFAIIEFKLDRTEKVKRTTSILLEETIEELEQKRKAIEESKDALQKSLEELKATQSQLVQSEKMASLGELTAGIAHEIQNPLNFVNNFSELNIELVEELIGNREKGIGDSSTETELLNDIKTNSEKINHHGKRADGIVKGMLQHSRSSTGQKEATDINALCDEYLRLAYHGLRAKDKTFNAEFKTEFDETIGKVNVQPQEMGRVILNLINNAFYACTERSRSAAQMRDTSYEPRVTVKTSIIPNPANPQTRNIAIAISDNGTGIPQHIKEKIFQPFFTTKPTGQGTGLGLSLAYDIVTKGHSGKLEVDEGNPEKFGMDSEDGKGTTFIVRIPIQ